MTVRESRRRGQRQQSGRARHTAGDDGGTAEDEREGKKRADDARATVSQETLRSRDAHSPRRLDES